MGRIAKIMLQGTRQANRQAQLGILARAGKAELHACRGSNVHACRGVEWSAGEVHDEEEEGLVHTLAALTGSTRYLWTCQGLPIPCGWLAGACRPLQVLPPRLATVIARVCTAGGWSGQARRWQRVQMDSSTRTGGCRKCKWKSDSCQDYWHHSSNSVQLCGAFVDFSHVCIAVTPKPVNAKICWRLLFAEPLVTGWAV